MTLIDIVIPCAGRAADLLRLLASLHSLCSESMPHIASITVTDDRHTEALRAQVARACPDVRYVAGPSRGPAANRNHGTRFGSADWLLFLDDDCYVQSDLIAAYLSCQADAPSADVFEGAIHAVGHRPNGNHHAPLNTTGGHLWSCNLMLRRHVFDSIGGFDEQYPFACLEDSDLALRLRAMPGAIVFARDAVVFHPWRSVSEPEIARQIVSHAIHGQKHPEFAADWDLIHLARAMRGRLRQYRIGRFSSIPAVKYRTVAFDLLAPFLVYALMRVGPIRKALADRYRNPPITPLTGHMF